MFGFGKKKKEEVVENSAEEVKMPSGMKETAERMMSGQFDMNDMLAQLKQIKKIVSQRQFVSVLFRMPNFFFFFTETMISGG